MLELKAIIRADGVVFNLNDLCRCGEQKFRATLVEMLYQADVVGGVDEAGQKVKFEPESSPAPDKPTPDKLAPDVLSIKELTELAQKTNTLSNQALASCHQGYDRDAYDRLDQLDNLLRTELIKIERPEGKSSESPEAS